MATSGPNRTPDPDSAPVSRDAAGALPWQILDMLREGCQVVGADWRYRYLNDTAVQHGRKPREELLGRRMQEAFPGIETTPVFPILEQVMATRVPAWHENHFTYPDGSEAWFDLRILPVPEGVLILSLDITEQKRTEQQFHHLASERKEEQHRLKLFAAIHQAAESVVVTDAEGEITYVNPAFERITGFTQDEVIGRNPRLLKSGVQESEFYAEMWRTLRTEGIWRGRLVNRRKDGTTYTQESTISMVRDPSGGPVGFVAVNRDVSNELQLEAQLAHAQRMETIGRLTGGIAHDFNNLLSVILGSSEFLLAETPADDSRRADLEEIRAAGERAAALTRQLLAFGRRQAVDPKVVDMADVVQRIEPMVRRLLQPDILLNVSSNSSSCLVKADGSQLDQLLMNLVVNARDAMPNGGRLTVQVSVAELDESSFGDTVVRPGRYVRLIVADTGVGMDEATKARAFEPFFTTKGVGEGTGLGLAMVYGIVNQCGGYIWLHSEPGAGTSFKIYLPCIQQDEPTSIPDVPTGSDHRGTGELVLVVEDEPAVLAVTRRILMDAGYRVVGALSVSEARKLFAQFGDDVALVLSDVVMPEGGGMALMDELRMLRPTLPVVLMSGYAHDAILQRGRRPGEFVMIGKPFTAEALRQRIREALHG